MSGVTPQDNPEAVLHTAWDWIKSGLAHPETGNPDLAEAWHILDTMERPAPVDRIYLLGQLARSHAPIFEAWATHGDPRWVNRGGLRETMSLVARNLVPRKGDPSIPDMDEPELDVIRQGVFSGLISRKRRRTAGRDELVPVAYPAPPENASPDFDDNGIGFHHMHARIPDEWDEPIPVRIGAVPGKGVTRVGSHHEKDGVLIIGLDQLLRGVAMQIRELADIYRNVDSSRPHTLLVDEAAFQL